MIRDSSVLPETLFGKFVSKSGMHVTLTIWVVSEMRVQGPETGDN
jgi:hypothetical protein